MAKKRDSQLLKIPDDSFFVIDHQIAVAKGKSSTLYQGVFFKMPVWKDEPLYPGAFVKVDLHEAFNHEKARPIRIDGKYYVTVSETELKASGILTEYGQYYVSPLLKGIEEPLSKEKAWQERNDRLEKERQKQAELERASRKKPTKRAHGFHRITDIAGKGFGEKDYTSIYRDDIFQVQFSKYGSSTYANVWLLDGTGVQGYGDRPIGNQVDLLNGLAVIEKKFNLPKGFSLKEAKVMDQEKISKIQDALRTLG